MNSAQNLSMLTLVYVTPWRLLSGRYTVGVALPFAYVETTVKFETKGPKRKATRTLSDSSFGFSDKTSSPKIASKSG
jgi:hypothetical protein